MAACNSPTLAVVGHSFVRRLSEFVEGRHLPRSERAPHINEYLNLRLEGENVAYFGQGGAQLNGGRPIFRLIHEWLGSRQFKVVYLDLGSNDLCDPDISAEKVASHLMTAARFILTGYSVNTVIIGQVTVRLAEPYVGYNAKVTATNASVRHKVDQEADRRIQCARLRGLMVPEESLFLPDGVHFSPTGNLRYAQGVRGAFIRALQTL